MDNIALFLQKLWLNEEGAVSAEYVVVLSLIGVTAFAGVMLLGGAVQKFYEDAAARFPR